MCRVYCYMYIKQTYNHTLQCTCITFDYNNEYDVFFSYKTLYLHQVSIGNTYIYKKGFNRFFFNFWRNRTSICISFRGQCTCIFYSQSSAFYIHVIAPCKINKYNIYFFNLYAYTHKMLNILYIYLFD